MGGAGPGDWTGVGLPPPRDPPAMLRSLASHRWPLRCSPRTGYRQRDRKRIHSGPGAPGHGRLRCRRREPCGRHPTITVYLAPKEKATGGSIVICPGGGIRHARRRARGQRGRRVAQLMGVAGVVLKYRTRARVQASGPAGRRQRAIRMVRWKSKEWGLDPDRVGVLGFSAGGHLASTLATHFRDAHPSPATRSMASPSGPTWRSWSIRW